MYLSDFVFFDDESTSAISEEFSLNQNTETMSLQISGESVPAITVQGIVDIEASEWMPLAILDQSDFDLLATISEPGIFNISVSGVKKIRLVCDGPVGGFKAYGLFSE